MIKITFKTANVLKHLSDSIKDLTQTVVFDISIENGLYMQAMDASAVSLCELRLPKEGFSVFECGNVPTQIGIHVGALTMIMKVFDGEKPVSIVYSDKNTDKVTVTDEERFTFELNVVDISWNTTLELPNKNYQTKLGIKSDFLKKLLNDIGDFCTRVSVQFDGQVVCFQFTGGEFGTAKTELRNIGIGEPLLNPLNFSLRYLRMFSRASTVSSDLEISLSPDEPIRFIYNMNSFTNGTLTYYLAPQIDS